MHKPNITTVSLVVASAMAAVFAPSAEAAPDGVKGGPYYVKFRTDSPSRLYDTGANATVEVYAADRHGNRLKQGSLDVWADDGWTNTLWRKTVDLAQEPTVKMTLTRSTPGSIRVYAKGNGIPVRQRMDRIIFGVDKIEPLTPCPDDFKAYWKGEKERLEREVPLAPDKKRAPDLDTPAHTFYRVSFATFNGERVYGLLAIPKTGTRFPVIVNVPGAGPGTRQLFPDQHRLMREGWITLLLNVHGIPLDGTNAEYHQRFKKWFAEYATKAGESRYQYVGYAKSREAPFYHRSMLGMTRAIEWLSKEPYADPTRFVYCGCSQGGGYGLYLTALWGRFSKSLIFCPNKCDMLAYRAGRQPGSTHIMDQKPENRAVAEKNAVYHDNCNFARMIHTPVRVLYGTADDNCQTIGGIAAYNRIASKDKQLKLLPGRGHGWVSDCYDKWLFE